MFIINCLFEIHIPYKSISHVFYAEVENMRRGPDKSTNYYYINSLKIVGYRFGDQIQLNRGYDHSDKYVNIYNTPFITSENTHQDYLKKSDEEKRFVNHNHEENDLFAKSWNDQRMESKKYICYGKYAETKILCESGYDEFGRPYPSGTWDKPCETNEECPFYQKNKNYPNSRGGCQQGTCEMPLGYELAGQRKVKSGSIGYCRNCEKKGELHCCEDQKNQTLYPLLKSPDYIFKDDLNERWKYKDQLATLGLEPL